MIQLPPLRLLAILLSAAMFTTVTMHSACQAADPPADKLYAQFREPTAEGKPFTYWWWKGNNATEAEISRQLELLHKAGFAGAHIMPLGKPTGTVEWLSPEWWRLMKFAVDEARKRDMQ